MKFKKYAAVMMAFVLILSVVLPCFAVEGEFAGGTGSKEDPYLISTKYQLDNVRNYLEANFKLINDIEFADEDYSADGDFYNDGKGFLPVGSEDAVFCGTLDGNGFSISNLKQNISYEEEAYAGIFARTGHATIKNLTLKNSEINAIGVESIIAGGFIGKDSGYSTITNCGIADSVEINARHCTHVHIGGMLGVAESNLKLNSSYNASSITIAECGDISAGGFIGGGEISFSELNKIYNSGKIYAQTTMGDEGIIDIGSIAGHLYVSVGPMIENAFNAGEITVDGNDDALMRIGGAIGCLFATHNPITIQRFYSVGKVNLINENAKISFNPTADYIAEYGGVTYDNLLSAFYCYFTDEYSALQNLTTDIYGAKVLDDEALKVQENYKNWDFENTWKMGGNEEYPYPELAEVELVLPSEDTEAETGDIDKDGNVNSRDIALLQKYIHGTVIFNRKGILSADVKSDGRINSRDLAALQRIVTE